jgi:putative DNA primase/helicase
VNCLAGCPGGEILAALRERGIEISPRSSSSHAVYRDAAPRPPLRKLVLVHDDWHIVTPVTEDAPPPPPMRKGNERYPYRDSNSRLLGYVERMNDANGEKLGVLPWTYCEHTATHRRAWRQKWFPTPRPIFGLDRLAEHPEQTVVICEGERKTMIASRVCPRYAWIGWPAGAKAAGRVDWTPLRGRGAILWPDADPSGIEAAQVVARIIKPIAASVRIRRPPAVPKGWDVADAIKVDGWGAERIVAFVEGGARDRK